MSARTSVPPGDRASFGSRIAPTRSASAAMASRARVSRASIVYLEVIRTATPPGRRARTDRQMQ